LCGVAAAVVAACALVLPSAIQASTGKHRLSCPASTKTAPHGRCRARLPKPGAQSPLGAFEQLSWIAARAGSPPAVKKRKAGKVPRALRRGLPSFVTDHAASTAIQRAFNVSMKRNGLSSAHIARAHASSGTQSGSEAGPTVNGWQTQLSGTSTHDDSRIGQQDVDATVTATKDAKVDDVNVAGTIALETRNRQLVDRCPNADGTVPGDGITRYALSVEVAAGNARAQISGSGSGYINYDWTYLGHVADDGTLRSFDLKMKATVLIEGGIRGADGKLYSAEAPKLYTVSSEIDDIDPNHPDAIKTFDMNLGGRAQIHSFLGHRYYEDKIAKDLLSVTEKLMSFNILEVSRYYKEAETNWQTPGNCVTVTPTAQDSTLAPGQHEPISVTINGPSKKGTAAGKFTAKASAGTVSPTSGSYTPGQPLALSFTAPQTGDATVTVETTSRQGKGAGNLTFHVKNPSYKLVFTSHGQLTYSGVPEPVAAAPSNGTEVRNEQWQVSSTIPLTGDPTTGLSGAAPVGYQQSAYHLDWEGWFSGQAGPQSCYGSDVTDLTSTAPGVAAVYKLTIASPGSAALLFNSGDSHPTENMQNVQTYPGTSGAGACPGANNSLPGGTQWWSEDEYFYSRQGMSTSVNGHPAAKIDSGWQPGTGNVVATRTITGSFPWLGAPGTPSVSTWTDTYQIVFSST
jgi:hypothetical protein